MILQTNDDLYNLVFENFITVDEERTNIQFEKDEYDSTGRHQEWHVFIFLNPLDNKYYQVPYSTSTQDSMGWDECNYPPHECVEVEKKRVISEVFVPIKTNENA